MSAPRCDVPAPAGAGWRDSLFPPRTAILGRCGCGAEVRADGFRDLRSRAEFRIGGACQACQDAFYLATSDRDDLLGHRFALRVGLVVGHRLRGCCLPDELATLPFVFTAPGREIAWEARAIVRAGDGLEPLDPWDELEAMRPVLAEHQVRVACADSLDAAELASLVADAELVIADPCVLAYLRAVAPGASACGRDLPDFVPARLRALEAAIVRLGLDPVWSGDTPSALRVCAWLGGVLVAGAADRILGARYSDRGVPLARGALA